MTVPAPADDLIADLVQALLDEERARREVRAALRRQAELLHALRSEGFPATLVAHRVTSARGAVLPVRERLRVAQRLRKRALRETSRPAILAGAHGLTTVATSPSERALMPLHQESNMAAKLIKRVITEEFVEADEDQEALDAEDVDESEDHDDEADDERKTSRRRR